MFRRILVKKGVFYLFTVLIFLGILILVLFTYNTFTLRDRQQSIEMRLQTMDDFIDDFHNDVHRATTISATRALISLEDYTSGQEEFFSNKYELQDKFVEVFYYGTIDGMEIELMNDTSFQDYENKVDSNAMNIGVDFRINVTQIILTQSSPWNVDVLIMAYVVVNDSSGLAYWDYNSTFETSVPIIGLRDPLYSINTLGRVQNTIRPSNVSMLVNGTDTSGIIHHISNNYYVASSDAPSFLMRFYGNTSSDPNGVESIIDIDTFSDQGIILQLDRPVIDYKYFSSSNDAQFCDFENMPSWFKVDSQDLLRYNLSSLNYTSCP
ncbi:MAG: hypothetical protein ACP5NV_02905 [Candidatus Woesearchaeota archaeon]